MADEPGDGEDKGVSTIDVIGLEMYQLHAIGDPSTGDKLSVKQLSEKFKVSERTVQRKLGNVKDVVSDLIKAGIIPSPTDGESTSDDPPGDVSRQLMRAEKNRVVDSGISDKHGDEFELSETNPLKALDNMYAIGKYGSVSGSAMGSGIAQLHQAFTRTDVNYSDRVMAACQGSGIVATH